LEKPFAAASKLPETEQNIVARRLLGELAAEKKWEATFSDCEDVLTKLADEELEEHEKGKTKRFNANTL